MSKKNKDFGIEKVLKNLGIKAENKGTSTGGKWFATGKVIESYSPVDGNLIAKVTASSKKDYEKVIAEAEKAFKEFRLMPAPKRGEIVRQFGDKLRKHKEDLGKLVSYEMGKHLGDIVDGNRKAELLKFLAQVENIELDQVIAVGDGANDLPMLNIAGLGIAFHAKPKVKENARQSISSIGLDGVLYFLGFRDKHINEDF